MRDARRDTRNAIKSLIETLTRFLDSEPPIMWFVRVISRTW